MTSPNSYFPREDGTGHEPLPALLSSFVQRHPGVEGSLVFTRDGLIRAFSSQLLLEDAERWAAIANQLFITAGSFAGLTRRGSVEHLTVRMSTSCLIVMEATPASGLALLTSRDARLSQVFYEATQLLENFHSKLPQELSAQVGAPLLLGAAT